MKVLGTILVFPSTSLKKDGTTPFKTFRGSITKNTGTKEDPRFLSMSIDVRFTTNYTNEQLNKFKDEECYKIDVTDGWLDFDNWEKEGVKYFKPVIKVANASILEHKPYNKTNVSKASEKVHNKPKNSKNADIDDLPF